MKALRPLFIMLLLVAAMLLTACAGDEVDDVAEPAAEDVVEEEEIETEDTAIEDAVLEEDPLVREEASMPDRIPIRWFVGLGAGSDEPTFAAQQAFVDEFNASQDEIELLLEIVDNDSAFDVLNTQIAAGNAPDIVGPMGIRGRASFPGAWLDLAPLIEETDYDLSDFDPALVEFYQVEGEQVGLPFAVFPSFIYFNKDLFDEAGLPYPPEEYGAPYVDENGEEHEWDIATLEALAERLTVDASGFDSTMEEFDPENIVQFGFGVQYTDIRGMATLFGAGSLVDEEGNAQFPEHWREAMHWYHQGMWEDWFYPNGIYGNSDILGAGNWFESGNLAMDQVHLWYAACCIGALDAQWGIAPVPSYEGEITAKLHADTFGILESTEHPEAAFAVLTAMLSEENSAELAAIYGGMPARLSLQDAYFESLEEQFPDQDINWEVAQDSLSYPDRPSHEDALPSFLEASDRYNAFGQLLANEPELDVDAAIDELIEDLQRIYDAAGG